MIPNCTVKSGLYANVRKLHSTYGNPHHVPMSYYLKLAVHTAHVYRVWQKVRLPGWMIPPSGGPCPRPLWQPWNRTYAEPCRWISRCTKKCIFMEKRVREISRFFVAPPRVFPLSVRARPRTVLSTNTSTLVCTLRLKRKIHVTFPPTSTHLNSQLIPLKCAFFRARELFYVTDPRGLLYNKLRFET